MRARALIKGSKVMDAALKAAKVVVATCMLCRALTSLIGELSLRSQPFREQWAAHDVEYYRSGIEPFRHPLAGDLDLEYDALEIPADPGQSIIAYSAAPGSPAHQALGILASWAAAQPRAGQLNTAEPPDGPTPG